MEFAERSLHGCCCQWRPGFRPRTSGILVRFDLMEERKQPTELKDRGRGFRLVGLLGARQAMDLGTALAALTAILLVSVGVGTSRGSDGAAPGSLADLGSAAGAREAPRSTSDAAIDDGLDERDLLIRAADSAAGRAPSGRLRLLSLVFPDRFGLSTAIDAPATASDAAEMRSYNGRPVRVVATLRMRVTAYSPDERSCGGSADGITASGYSVLTNGGFLVAADPRVLPLGSLLSIPGYDDGAVVPVLDTGGAIKGNRLDVLYPTHELAVQWGVQELVVEVWEYADGLPSGFRRVRRPAK